MELLQGQGPRVANCEAPFGFKNGRLQLCRYLCALIKLSGGIPVLLTRVTCKKDIKLHENTTLIYLAGHWTQNI